MPTWLSWLCDAIGLVSALHDADGIINCTITFLRSRQYKWGVTWPFWSCYPLALTLAAYDTNGIVNGTIAFLRSRQLKCNRTFWLCGVICIGITWHQWYCQWHMTLMLALAYKQSSQQNAMVSLMASWTLCYFHVHNKN